MADRNYLKQTQGDADSADALKHTTVINISSLAGETVHDTFYYPGNAKSMFWVSSDGTPDSASKVYLCLRGAAGGSTASQYAILKDDAPNTPAIDGSASDVAAMIAGQCPGDMIPHEFTFYNDSNTAVAITLYINY